MSFFYDLNKRLNGLRADDKQITESVARAQSEAKTPARVSLEESLKQDMRALMEDGSGGMSQSNTLETKSYSAKKAAAGKDIGKPGKNFEKIAKSAGKEYGSKEAGERVAGAVLNKLRAKESAGEVADKDYDGDGKKESPKAEYLGSRIAAGKKAAEKMKEQISGEEQVTELSPNTLKSYTKKAANSAVNKGAELGQKMAAADEVDRYTNRHFPKGTQQFAQRDAMRSAVGAGYDEINQSRGKAQKRVAGIGKAVDRLTKEDGLPDIADKGAKMAIARGDKPGPVKHGPLKNVGKGLKAFFKGEPEPMDEEQEMMNFLARKAGPQASPQGHAQSQPYNRGTRYNGEPDAYNGMEFEGEEMTLEASVSRKHFQQVADLLKNIPDEAKRKELAMHHASIFKQQNPRFDIARFGQAAGVDLMEISMYEELKGGQHKLDVDGDGDIGGDDLADLRSGKEVDEGYADMDAYLKSLKAEKGTGKFDKRERTLPSGMKATTYTRKFDDEAEDDTDAPVSKGGAPRGRGRPAVAKKPERVTGGSYKYKAGRNNPKEMNESDAQQIDAALEQIKKDVQMGDVTAIEILLQSCQPAALMSYLSDNELDEQKVEAGKREFFDKLAPAAKKVAKVVGTLKGSKKPVDEESTGKEDTKAERAGKKVAKDIEHDEGHKGKDDDRAEKAGKKVTRDIEFDDKKDKKDKKEKKADKEEKVDETTTSGSVATAATSKKSSSAGAVGKGIYDSWEREFNTLLSESVNVSTEASMMEDGNEEEAITITATGDDVARLRDVLAQLGVVQSGPEHDHDHDEPYANSEACGTCGGVPCQCDEMDADMGLPGAIEFELDEADAPVSANSPDYPTNQECSNDALQYAGGLNKPKSTGQTTIPVIANQGRQTSMESTDPVDSFLNLYSRFKTK